VRDGRPYPDHGMSTRDWALIPPRQVRLDSLTTTKRELALDAVLADDSTFYGDLFPHAVQWHGELYLEDGGPAGGAAAADRHPRAGARPGRPHAGAALGRAQHRDHPRPAAGAEPAPHLTKDPILDQVAGNVPSRSIW
jgi:Arc/MetJ family transcription regulator